MKAIIALLILASTTSNISETNADELQQPPVKENIFLTMERTPCFGQCPSFKFTIFNTGMVIYEGFNFVKKEGKYKSKLTRDQLNEIIEQIESKKIFNLQDKYDAKITDIPSCILYINLNGKKKKIYDRHGAPNELKQFEKLVEKFVLDSPLGKISDAE